MPAQPPGTTSEVDVDVVVVGAGMGGIAAVHRLDQRGFSVLGLEKGGGVGGVWYHNSYPGARVDLESMSYCYYDPELYEKWTWSERYCAQPELLRYLNFAADTWGVRPHYRFNTTMTEGRWDEDSSSWVIATDDGRVTRSRFLIMATGPLSASRHVDIPGLDDFAGRRLVTAHWPEEEVDLTGQRVGVVGTSATGVQLIPYVAEVAAHLHVFQRTPHYVVPAQNHPLDPREVRRLKDRRAETWDEMLRSPSATAIPGPVGAALEMSPQARRAAMESRWRYGGHGMTFIFSDQATDPEANEIVAEFTRERVLSTVKDPEVARSMVPRDYPIGTHRVGVDLGCYYDTFNRDNVTLVDLKRTPIERVTPEGVRTSAEHVPLDTLILATGFDAMTGALYRANITGVDGQTLQDAWRRGPTTFVGLMTRGFPNLLIMVGPGSPSVLANMFAGNEHHALWISRLLSHARDHDIRRIEPRLEAQQAWDEEVDRVASQMLRYNVKNYMVHVNPDGTRVFQPYPGGFNRYVAYCADVEDGGYRELELA